MCLYRLARSPAHARARAHAWHPLEKRADSTPRGSPNSSLPDNQDVKTERAVRFAACAPGGLCRLLSPRSGDLCSSGKDPKAPRPPRRSSSSEAQQGLNKPLAASVCVLSGQDLDQGPSVPAICSRPPRHRLLSCPGNLQEHPSRNEAGGREPGLMGGKQDEEPPPISTPGKTLPPCSCSNLLSLRSFRQPS